MQLKYSVQECNGKFLNLTEALPANRRTIRQV